MIRALIATCLLLTTACGTPRLVNRPEDCPTGCYTAAGTCFEGTIEPACGSGGLSCNACTATEACIDQRCQPQGAIETERITWGPGFESAGNKPLSDDISRLTTLQPEEDARSTAAPTVFGLRPAMRDIVTLGDWAAFGGSTTRVASAVAVGDEAAAGLAFLDVFAGNRRLVMTGYSVGGTHRLSLFTTDPVNRRVGVTSEFVAGSFAAAPIGDFYFLSAPGLMTATGSGVYGFLDGPSLNSARRVAAYPQGGTPGVGLMALARGNIGLFGAADAVTGAHQIHACTLAAYMDAYTAAANLPWPLSLATCPTVYQGGADTAALARVAGGFAILSRGAQKQTIHFVPLVVTGTGAAQAVAAGAAELLAELPNGALVESMTDYGDDLLLVLRRSAGRSVERAHRK